VILLKIKVSLGIRNVREENGFKSKGDIEEYFGIKRILTIKMDLINR